MSRAEWHQTPQNTGGVLGLRNKWSLMPACIMECRKLNFEQWSTTWKSLVALGLWETWLWRTKDQSFPEICFQLFLFLTIKRQLRNIPAKCQFSPKLPSLSLKHLQNSFRDFFFFLGFPLASERLLWGFGGFSVPWQWRRNLSGALEVTVEDTQWCFPCIYESYGD